MAKENREFKDSVFTDLFYSDVTARQNLLSLCNALFNTSYDDPNIIEKVRLEDVLFRNFKNDIALTLQQRRIILGEHQSTPNENMPLRMLMYIAREMEKLISSEKRYQRSLVKIPTPEFYTFYIGKDAYPAEKTLSLSDAFMEPMAVPSLELKVKVININKNKNHELLTKCDILGQYSSFVENVRKYMGNERALENAVKSCINEGILEDYLSRKSTEVINMLMTEYDYDMDLKVQSEEAAREAANREQKQMIQLATKLFQLNDAEGFAKLQTASPEEIHEMCRKFGIIK